MSQLGNGAWTGDCKNADGAFTVASYDCPWAAIDFECKHYRCKDHAMTVDLMPFQPR